MSNMKYRADIDGLRAVSVIAVILFHSGFEFISGGYIGVDIFFVISGYLITGLVYDEVKTGQFTISGFYKRRIARLFPALIITLLLVLIFGFFFYDNNAFDNLGKEIFFSAIGAANILFAQGINYFAQEEAVRPLIHLWSLGVEEQFYLVWPTIILLLASISPKKILIIFAGLFLISFVLAVSSVDEAPISTYFYPQYRAFELIVGAMTAIWMRSTFFQQSELKRPVKELLVYFSVGVIFLSMIMLDKNSTFPGFNSLYACFAAALIIIYSPGTTLFKVLSVPPLVLIGLISYPLYLYHQPVISYIYFFNLTSNNVVTFLIVILSALPMAWLTYKYIEKPIRKAAHKKNKVHYFYYIAPLVLVLISISGLYIAKNNGLGERFQVLNAFAYDVSKHSESTFENRFERGISLTSGEGEKILFVGDSLVQQYVYPISQALGFDVNNIDVATRGGCVLLKDIKFLDVFSDISCNDLRKDLYQLKDRKYKYVVITQNWHSDSYDKSVLNFKTIDKDNLNNWSPFIKATLDHFKLVSDTVILIGGHVEVEGTEELKPTIFLSQAAYDISLNKLKVINAAHLSEANNYFNQWQSEKVFILQSKDLWLDQNKDYKLHDDNWAYFMDSLHVSNASTQFVIEKFKKLFKTLQ